LTKKEIEMIGGEDFVNEANDPNKQRVATYFPVEKLINFFL
jgi:hypothetical protein